MQEDQQHPIDTGFYIPLYGDGHALERLAADIGFATALQSSFEGHNLVSKTSLVTIERGLVAHQRAGGNGREADGGRRVLFVKGSRVRANDGEDDYFDHLDAERYVSSCHSAISPSRSRALDAWRRSMRDLLRPAGPASRFITPGSRTTAMRDGTIIRIRHELEAERRHRRIRLSAEVRITMEEQKGYMMFYLVDGAHEIGPVPVTAAETGVGMEAFLKTLEAAAGEPVVRRTATRKGATS